jgi:hypothetical protein
LQQCLLVDQKIDREAHTLILERFEIVIEIDEVPVQWEPGDDLKLRVALHFLHPVSRNVVDHMHFAGA